MKKTEKAYNINRICTPEDRKLAEASLRTLWRECFEDPLIYEEFYFTNIYRKNIVYKIEDKGMLHLNPYLCQVKEKRIKLSYIVGVGTAKAERRKGIMGSLIKQALFDLYSQKQPFTYLMPADVRYYEPFSFISISEKTESFFSKHNILDETDINKLRFVTYEEISRYYTNEQQQELFQFIHDIMKKRYAVFAIHNKEYFDLLYREKQCQKGNVVFCFDGSRLIENFKGFFAYSMERDRIYVEQSVFLKDFYKNIQKKYAEKDSSDAVSIVNTFPFMVRVVHAETFMQLFMEDFRGFAEEKTILRIEDAILSENNGWYFFDKEDNGISITKQSDLTLCDNYKGIITMSIDELASYIFKKTKKNSVFFGEIV